MSSQSPVIAVPKLSERPPVGILSERKTVVPSLLSEKEAKTSLSFELTSLSSSAKTQKGVATALKTRMARKINACFLAKCCFFLHKFCVSMN
jgi:hypothetical protein